MGLDLKELLDTCQVEAISNKMSPTEDSHWRYVCRKYSTSFSTPLHEVMKLDPKIVILNVYEHELEGMDTADYENLEKLLEAVMSISDPEYSIKKAKDLDNMISRFEAEEEDRIKSGKPIGKPIGKPKKVTKTLLENPKNIEEKLPTGGSIDLSHLAALDGEEG